MKISETSLPSVLMIEPKIFNDDRGFFMETYHEERYRGAGINLRFVQDNFSYSVYGTLRGLHYQYPHGQAKLVQVLMGEVFDVAVDIRRGSPTFGQWCGEHLSDKNRRQMLIPEGYAHGFCALSETALFIYKCTDFYTPDSERGILWSDHDLGIEWPVDSPLLSEKDSNYQCLSDVPVDALPVCA